MIPNIHSVTIYVVNQTEAVRFYRDLLGFEVRRWEPLSQAGSWIEMAPPGSSTSLVLYPQADVPDSQSRRAFVIFDCENLESEYERLAASGVNFTQEPNNLGWGMMAVFADPYGNEFGLMQVTKAPSLPGGGPSRPPGGAPPPPPPPPPR